MRHVAEPAGTTLASAPRLRALTAALLLLTICPSVTSAGQRADSDASAQAQRQRIRELIIALDDDRYGVREAAERQLRAVGPPALPALREALHHASAEVRHRARRIARHIEHEALVEAFARLGAARDDAQIDLDEGMFLIARILDADFRREHMDRTLDALAARVRRKLPGKPAEADPQRVIEAMREVLCREEGFTGNAANYDEPDNSSIQRVLRTRQGLPILLSHLWVSVAERLDVPLVGLAIPYHYMIKYEGRRAPDGCPKTDVVIDPYHDGRTLTMDELEDFLARRGAGFDPNEHLRPSPRRATLERMLSNLRSDLVRARRWELALRVGTYRDLLAGPQTPLPRPGPP